MQSLDQFYVIDTLLQLISIFIKPENKINMQFTFYDKTILMKNILYMKELDKLKINLKYVKWFI